MKKLKVLNLYAGIGGNRKLWEDVEVTAVEIDPEIAKFYTAAFPEDTVIIADAHEYLLKHYKEFDFIWGSPPCPSHSDIRRCGVHSGQYEAVYPEMALYQEIIFLDNFFPKGRPWVIENVDPYYTPLIPPVKKMDRHLWWCNFKIGDVKADREISHQNIQGNHTIYGFNISETAIENKRKVLRNMVNPIVGRHILDCARGIIRKKNEKQLEIFDL